MATPAQISANHPPANRRRLLTGGNRALATVQRYATVAERSYYKAHAELMNSRQLRNEAANETWL
jgi:hypothetical protein